MNILNWHDFFIATSGAAAALTGLIFVGVSISLAKILSIAALPGRALISLILLLAILIMSVLVLIPDQSFRMIGIELLSIGLTVWIIVSKMDVNIFRNKAEKQYQRLYAFNMLLNQVAVIPYLIGGILLIASCEAGLYCIAIAILFSFLKSVLDAWVLLVEINR